MEPEYCCFDDWAKSNAKRARKKGTAAPVTRRLLEALESAGLRERTVLDVGCGTGDLALATLAHGAARATGFDLGAGAIGQARSLAAERGLSDRARFEVGDGSAVVLEPHDVVALNRVICCYPDAAALLANTLGAAGSVFAFTAPVDAGAGGAFNRVLAGVANRWYALRRKTFGTFRVFIHDLGTIDARIRAAGFARVSSRRVRLVWQLAVYTRPS